MAHDVDVIQFKLKLVELINKILARHHVNATDVTIKIERVKENLHRGRIVIDFDTKLTPEQAETQAQLVNDEILDESFLEGGVPPKPGYAKVRVRGD